MARAGFDIASRRLPWSATRLRHPSARARLIPERDRRPPRTPVARDNAHLCQGRFARITDRRRLPSGGTAVNINDLATHYVAFRRTLGERSNTTENILRSFCRAVGLRTPVARIRSKVVDKFLAG